MIAKRVARDGATSSAAKLVRYMVAAVGGIDPNTWARTTDYILDTKEETIKGEKVGSFRVTNCDGLDDPADATLLIQSVQAQNKRSTTDKTYHLVYSFPPGETPSLEVLHAIEDELCAAIGFADHQRISAVHTDTDHLHVHVCINKVHPTGLQNIEPYYDKKRLMEACERLEVEYGLERTNHGLTKDNDNERTNNIRLNAGQQPNERDSRFRRYLRESYDLKITDEPEAKTLNGLRKLSSCRLDGQTKSDPVLLPGDARSGVQPGGTNDSERLRRPRNGDRTDDGQDGGVRGIAADIEADSGIETLAGYAARELAPSVRKATSWQEVHAAAAEHGLEVNKRGAGLVIGDPGIPLWAKASSCGRDLSLKSLTDRLGPYEPSEQKQQTRPPGSKAYSPKPRQTTPSSAGLFAQYQRERQANVVARRNGLAQTTRESKAFTAQWKNWRATQTMLIKVAAKGPTRRLMTATIKQQGDASREANRREMAARREKIFKETTTPAWADWLVKQAQQGNADALEVLRSKEQKERQWHGDLLTAERSDKAKAVVLKQLNPKARKDGSMAYQTVDGGMVIDRSTHVQATKATTGAALVALDLASKRFEGQALIVEGTAEFKQEVAQLAGMHGLNVRFVDPMMEQARQETANAKEMEMAWQAETRPQERAPKGKGDQSGAGADVGATNGRTVNGQGESPKATAGAGLAVTEWVESRNKNRDKISSIDYHRLWAPTDAGTALYQGRRSMKDGSEVLLLKRGDEMLVKPSGPQVVAKASKWKLGQSVQLDARGRFITGSKGVEL